MNVLEEALLVVSERQTQYGQPEDCFTAIAECWTALLRFPVAARDVCRMMIAFKLCRDSHQSKRDNLVDVAGYALCAERVPDPAWVPSERELRVVGEQIAEEAAKAEAIDRLDEAIRLASGERVAAAVYAIVGVDQPLSVREIKLGRELVDLRRQLADQSDELHEAELVASGLRQSLQRLRGGQS